jgi:hypothetical protein
VRGLHQLAGLAFGSLVFSNVLYYGAAIKALNRDWRRRLWQLPRLLLMGSSLVASSAVAVMRGLLGGPIEWTRTNKYGGAGVCPYGLPPVPPSVRLLEFAVLLAALLGIAGAVRTGIYGAIPYFAWTAAAMMYAVASRWIEFRRERRRWKRAAPERRADDSAAPELAEPARAFARRIA